MWKDHLGENANLHNFVAILEQRTDSKDCVAYLKKTFALSSLGFDTTKVPDAVHLDTARSIVI